MTKPTIPSPSKPEQTADYDKECREALRPFLEELVAAAEAAGWDRQRAAYELMYLASFASRE